jgi:hypothetical protein
MKSYPILLLVAALAFSHLTSAAVVGTSGNMSVFPSASADYTAGPYNDPAPAPTHLWIEQSGISLSIPVVLDTDLADTTMRYVTGAAGAGEVAFPAAGGPTLNAGEVVDVYYAYLDPAGTQSGTGSVTFDRPILGIVAYTERLPFSDFLRVPGAPYPGNPAFNARGWENTEWAQLSADRLTLTFFGTASNPGDQFRIFVTAVPEPSAFALLSAGMTLLVVGVRRRRPDRQP